jgi:uncharacterized protein (DUF433 family)
MAEQRVVVDPQIMGRVPCIRGTRIPAAIITGLIAEDCSIPDVLNDYPQLTREDVLAALRYPAAV